MEHATASIRRRRAALLFALAAGATTPIGCSACRSGEGRQDSELSGLVHSPAEAPDTIDVERAARDLAELTRATTLSHAQVGALVGAHTVTGRSHSEVREKGTIVETLDDEIGIEFDAKGNFHAQLDNSKEYGRDVYMVDGWLYLRARYGKFHRRRPTDDGEPGRIRSEVYGAVGAALDLLSPAVAVSDGGVIQVAGRKARLIKLSTLSQPRKPPAEVLSQRKWRETATVRQVTGELVLDSKTGVVLRALVQGVVAYQRDGRGYEMRVEARHELGTFGAVEDVAPPEPELVAADGEQRHEIDERDSLLEGIAPKAARGRKSEPASGKRDTP